MAGITFMCDNNGQARGRACSTSLAVLFMGAYYMFMMAQASQLYAVGNDKGWGFNNGVNYTQWAANNTYFTGDTLFFQYAAQTHSVLQVTGDNYKTCNTNVSTALFTDNGNGNTNFTLMTAQKYWFICGVSSHCSAGSMKFSIEVTSTTPAAAPAPAPPSAEPPSSSSSSSSTLAFLILLGPLTLLTFFL